LSFPLRITDSDYLIWYLQTRLNGVLYKCNELCLDRT
jgi:hypothetical protein